MKINIGQNSVILTHRNIVLIFFVIVFYLMSTLVHSFNIV